MSTKIDRVIIKLGSSLLTHGGDRVNDSVINSLVFQMAKLHMEGTEIILVSSGAIAAGRSEVSLPKEGLDVPLRQVLAAIGQGLLLHRYEQAFAARNVRVAQALLTRHDLTARLGYLNIRNTLLKLIEIGVVPIVNENDVVNIEQVSDSAFGDNDTLSALVANLVDADLLIILGELDGLHTKDPHIDPSSELVTNVQNIDENILSMGGESFSADGVPKGYGGMSAKLQAAKLVTASGTAAIMASGLEDDVLIKLTNGQRIGTYFEATGNRLESRKRWMLSGVGAKGKVVIDEGAAKAIIHLNRSLLPAGVTEVVGNFDRGDIINLLDLYGSSIATGISNYGSTDIELIMGLQSDQITDTLGHQYGAEIVHRSNLVKL